MKSKALEVNLSDTRADVSIDVRYQFLMEVFQGYVGILNRMETFLKELSHPYRNWEFIVGEARHFSLHYFYLYKDAPQGGRALATYVDILFLAFEANRDSGDCTPAADNLMVLFHQIAKEAKGQDTPFWDVLEAGLERTLGLDGDGFQYFVQSYYQPDKLAALVLDTGGDIPPALARVQNQVLMRYYGLTFSYWLSQDDPVQWMQDTMGDLILGPELMEILDPVSHARIQAWQEKLETLSSRYDSQDADLGRALIELTGFREFVKKVRAVPRHILGKYSDTYGRHLKLTFLF